MSMSVSFAGLGSIPGVGTDPVPYRLAVFPFPPGHFQVHAFEAREALSKPYTFDITVTTKVLVGEDIERLALGQRAAFVMTLDGVTRVVPGLVAAVRSEGVRPGYDAAQYRLRLVPSLWRLGRIKDSRIFQNLTVAQIVQTVLAIARIPTRSQLTRKYPIRPYCTQYQESDLEFVERLLAEAGIFYFFTAPASGLEGLLQGVLGAESSAAGDALAFAASAVSAVVFPEETLVLTDDPACYAPVAMGGILGAVEAMAQTAGALAGVSVGPLSVPLPAPSLHYSAAHGFAVGRSDKVTDLVAERSVRSTTAEYRDFDPERPNTVIVASEPRKRVGVAGSVLGAVEGAAAELSANVEIDFEHGPSISGALGAAAMGALSGLLQRHDLETYEHHGRFLFPDWRDCEDEPGRMRRERGRRKVMGRGESLCHNLTPGHRFHLADHPIGPLNREYVVTAVRHHGKVASEAELYENSFECAPASVAFPPKRKKRGAVATTLTATVAGPATEEIYVDAAGRIKVQFHWDRRGRNDEFASCWVRHLEPWGGTGFGHQFIPRIGMEVLVVFEGGDPDKPIVVGSLYNGTHPPAFPLPANKTRSGLRTQSTPRAVGFNELSFEDAAGNEQIYVRAQRDLDEEVLRNHTLKVARDEVIRVGGLRRDEVAEDLTEVVGGSKDVAVKGDHATEIDGSLLETVGRNADYRVHGLRQVRIDASDRLEVAGAAEHRVGHDLLTRVEGNHTVIVGKNEAKRAFTLRVEGTTTLSSEDRIILESQAGITLSCGATTLRIGKDGVELVGDLVRLAAGDAELQASKTGMILRSSGAYLGLGAGLLAKTQDASLSMNKEFKADATRILFNSPDKATDPPQPKPVDPTEIVLADADGHPLPNQRFVVELDDGSERCGATDKDGKCKLTLSKSAQIRFPDLANVKVA